MFYDALKPRRPRHGWPGRCDGILRVLGLLQPPNECDATGLGKIKRKNSPRYSRAQLEDHRNFVSINTNFADVVVPSLFLTDAEMRTIARRSAAWQELTVLCSRTSDGPQTDTRPQLTPRRRTLDPLSTTRPLDTFGTTNIVLLNRKKTCETSRVRQNDKKVKEDACVGVIPKVIQETGSAYFPMPSASTSG